MKFSYFALALLLASMPWDEATARDLISTITESPQMPALRPEFQTPKEANQLFYIERSPNSNTVVYVAHLDAGGNFDADSPVIAYWRWFNVDGRKKPLNFVERMLAYGVRLEADKSGDPISFSIAALPERKLTLAMDDHHHPEALMTIGTHRVRLAYVYLKVEEGGLLPRIPWLDILGTDVTSGMAIEEHLVQE